MSARRFGTAPELYAAAGLVFNQRYIHAARKEMGHEIADHTATYPYAVQYAEYVEKQKIFQEKRAKRAIREEESNSLRFLNFDRIQKQNHE